jgi:hypothetical protein
VFAAILLAFVIVVAFGIVSGIAGDAIAGDAGRVIIGTIASILTAPIAALVASLLFFDLGGGGDAPTAPAAGGPPAY